MAANVFGLGAPVNPLQINPFLGAYGPQSFGAIGSPASQQVAQVLQQLQVVPQQLQYAQATLQQIQQALQVLPQQVQQIQQVIQFLPQQIAQILQQVLIPASFAAAAPGFTGLGVGQLGSIAGGSVGQTGFPFQTAGPNPQSYVM